MFRAEAVCGTAGRADLVERVVVAHPLCVAGSGCASSSLEMAEVQDEIEEDEDGRSGSSCAAADRHIA